MSENADKRTATQKIEDLEKVVTVLYQGVSQIKNAVENLFRSQGDMALVKDALKILNKKTEAIIQLAAPETGITVAAVSNLIVQMNVEDLKAQVAGYLANGHLLAAEEVAADSYLVCEEYNKDGSLANPRIQFRVDSQDEATAGALKGKKVGDSVEFGEDRFSAKILEIYSVVEPQAAVPAAETAPEVAQSESAPAAAAPATEAAPAAPAKALDTPPAESPVDFSIDIHGQSEATLTAPVAVNN